MSLFHFILLILICAIEISSSDEKKLELNFYKNNYNNCKCGLGGSFSSTKIVGGLIAKDKNYPWMVALLASKGNRNYLLCGGSLISNYYILTAAHCLDGLEELGIFDIKATIKIFLGSNKLPRFNSNDDTDGNNGIFVKIRSYKIHPKFDPIKLDYDLALIKLEEEIHFTENIWPICLNREWFDLKNENGIIVTGWGFLFENSGVSVPLLRETKVQILPIFECQENYSTIGIKLTNNMICARGKKQMDSCSGDSGSPLSLKMSNGFYTQIGIVSFGYGCAQPNFAGIYTKILSTINWINANTQDAKYCTNPN